MDKQPRKRKAQTGKTSPKVTADIQNANPNPVEKPKREEPRIHRSTWQSPNGGSQTDFFVWD